VVILKQTLGEGLEQLVEPAGSELLHEAGLRLDLLHYPGSARARLRHLQLLDNSNSPLVDVICNDISEERNEAVE
jgi:hypothetical protein